MGYDTVFHPTKERMESFKPYMDSDALNEYIMAEETKLVAMCMKGVAENDYDGFYVKLIKGISSLTVAYKALSKAYVYESWEKSDDGTFWFCGWKYANPECDMTEFECKKSFVKDFCVLAFSVRRPDWFTEAEYFYELLNEINERLECFKEGIMEIEEFEIMNEFGDVREKDDDIDDICDFQEDSSINDINV